MSIKPLVQPTLGALLTSLIKQRKRRESRARLQAVKSEQAFSGLESLEQRQMLSIDFTSLVTLGGSGNETAQQTIVDHDGNVFAVGSFVGKVDFDPSGKNKTLKGQNAPGTLYVAKYDAAGKMLWARSLGEDTVIPLVTAGLAVDDANYLYIAGSFEGSVDFDPGKRKTLLTSAGEKDVFVTKLDFQGELIWARRFGGEGDDVATSLSINGSNQLAVAGRFTGTVDFDPGTGVASATAGVVGNGEFDAQDGFVATLSSQGVFQNAFTIDTPLIDTVVNDDSGNVYIAGHFAGLALDFAPLESETSLASSSQVGAGVDFFVASYSAAHSLNWLRTVTGMVADNAIGLDSAGNLLLAGHGTGDVVDSDGSGDIAISFPEPAGGYLLALDADTGAFNWVNQLGGNVADLDISGDTVFVAGSYRGPTDFNPAGSPLVLDSATSSAFVASYDSTDGLLHWARPLVGTGSTTPTSVGFSDGEVVVGGAFTGVTDFNPNRAVNNGTSKGGTDTFIARLTQSYAPDRVRLNVQAPVTFTDADGDIVTITIKGPGSGYVYFNEGEVDTDILAIDLTKTTNKTTLTISTAGSNGSTSLAGLTVAGALGFLNAPTTTLRGAGVLSGTLGQLALGDANGASLTVNGTGASTRAALRDVNGFEFHSASPVASLNVHDWNGGLIAAPSIGPVNATQNLNFNIELSGVNVAGSSPVLGNVTAGGSLGGAWNVGSRRIGTVSVGSVGAGWNLTAGDIGAVNVTGNFAGVVQGRTIKTMAVGGSIVDAHITLVSGNVNALAKLTVVGFIDGSDIRTTGNFGDITAGAVRNSNIFAGVNNRPSLTNVETLHISPTTTLFDPTKRYYISYSDLRAAGDERDLDTPDTLSFRIVSVSSGTLTLNGVPVTPGDTLITGNDAVLWTPDNGSEGDVDAFTLVAYDGTLASNEPVQVKVYVRPDNVAPTLTTVSTLSGASEDQPFTISYAALAAAGNEFDADSLTTNNLPPLSFRIESVSSGTLTKDGNPVVAGDTLLSSGQSLVWTPDANANGTLAAFTVVAYDGTLASASPVQVNVAVAAVNDAPTLTSIQNLIGASAETAYNISYNSLAAAADEADVDSATIFFRVSTVNSGTLTLNGVPVELNVTTLGPGESFVWTPAAGTSGVINAFSVIVTDGSLLSSPAVDVLVQTVGTNNNAPTLTTLSSLTGATQGVPYDLTFFDIAAAGNEFDADGDNLYFRIGEVSSGQLLRNGVALSGGSVLRPGDALTWIGPANENGIIDAFTVTAFDGVLASNIPLSVKIEVAANNAPTLTRVENLTGAVEDQAYTIAFADFAEAANEEDADLDALSFKITSVNSGTLKLNGTVVTGGETFSAGDTLVWTPDANVSGLLNAFSVVASDGKTTSATPVAVNIVTTERNDAPTLTSVDTFRGAHEGQSFTITYEMLLANANEADIDSSDLSFRVEAVNSGTLTKNGSLVIGAVSVGPGESLVWTPAVNDTGVLRAFTITAYDGEFYSSTPVQVRVDVIPGLPDERSDFASDRRINSFVVTGIVGQPFAFINSNIAANTINSLRLKDIQTDNAGVAFGSAAINYGSARGLTDLGDFKLRVITL